MSRDFNPFDPHRAGPGPRRRDDDAPQPPAIPGTPARPPSTRERDAAIADADALLAQWMNTNPAAQAASPGPAATDPALAKRLAGKIKLANEVRPPIPGAVKALTDADLGASSSGAGKRLASEARATDERDAALKRVAYHAKRLAGAGLAEDEVEEHWTAIEEAVERFVRFGGSSEDEDLYQTLDPVAEDFPEWFEAGPALREALGIERLESTHIRAQRESIERAKRLLNGRVMLLIGGSSRPLVAEALADRLELKEVRWLDSRPHQSTAPFEPDVARPEVGIVVLAIRWSSHSFEDVKRMCVRYNKLFVRLPAGYGVMQVAHHVVEQAGKRLGGP